MELIILDDTPAVFDMTPFSKYENIRYIHVDIKMKLPAKRNKLNKLGKGEIFVCFDDDDYYPPSRVSHAVKKLLSTKALIAGSTELYIYDTTTKMTYRMGPYAPNHGTNGTFAYKREYLKDNRYDEDTDRTTGEEKAYCKDFTNPLIQLNPWDTIICFNHKRNTFDKAAIFRPENIVKIDIKKVIKDKTVRDFFMSL